MNQHAYSNYCEVNLQAQIAGASSVQLLLVLMNGLLDELARTRSHIVARRFEAKGRSIQRCTDILSGMTSALDFEMGGEVVQNLARLYDYAGWRLNEAGLSLKPELVDEVMQLMTVLRDAWVEVDQNQG